MLKLVYIAFLAQYRIYLSILYLRCSWQNQRQTPLGKDKLSILYLRCIDKDKVCIIERDEKTFQFSIWDAIHLPNGAERV